MGDNRLASNDSRDWGTVPIENISGKAWITYWPFTNFSVEKHR
jgi:signal peptidase I